MALGTTAGLPAAGVDASDLAPWTPSGSDVWDRKKAAHLMRRAGYGAKPEELDAIVQLGMDRAVDLLLTPSTSGLQAYGTVILPHGEVLNLTSSLAGQRAQWIWECAYTAHPLKEKLALFWADHFSVGSENQTAAPLLIQHINTFRKNGLGSFRQMLVDVTVDPAMLRWLDNYLNGRRGQINENYGRELLELYTRGVDNGYTQTDVVEASKCLSGWTLLGQNQSAFEPRLHIGGPKTVIGRVIDNRDGSQDLYDLLDAILAGPETGQYVVGKIWSYFVSEEPEPELIKTLGSQWQKDGYNIRALMSTILRSHYFYTKARRKLIKNPMEFVVGAIRNTGMTPIARYTTLSARVEAIGLPLLRYADPSGLADGAAWIDSQSLINRANFANELTQVGTSGIRASFDPRREIRRAGLQSSQQVVDHYAEFFLDDDAPPLVRWTLNEFLNRDDGGPVAFVPNTPAGDLKMRGFMHLLLTLPEYQIN